MGEVITKKEKGKVEGDIGNDAKINFDVSSYNRKKGRKIT